MVPANSALVWLATLSAEKQRRLYSTERKNQSGVSLCSLSAVSHARVSEEHGPIAVDIEIVREPDEVAVGFPRDGGRHAAALANDHQTVVRVGDVELAGLPVEPQTQRPAAEFLLLVLLARR